MATPPKPDDQTLPASTPSEKPAAPASGPVDREALIAALHDIALKPPSRPEKSDPKVPAPGAEPSPTGKVRGAISPSLAHDPAASGKRPAAQARPASGSDPNLPSFTARDTYAGRRHDVKPLEPGKAAAAEVSQGAWRERAFTPRGVMSPEEILLGLNAALDAAKGKPAPKTIVLQWLRDEWLQFLRQAVEQAGGDALDVWLSAALKPREYKTGLNLVLVELYVVFQKMRGAASTEAMLDAAAEAVAAVRGALEAPHRRAVSFKVLERELEGKIDVDGLLLFLLASDDELAARAEEIGQTLERIRKEVKKMPGAKPDGMYSNFARLRAEARLIDGELKRRARAGP